MTWREVADDQRLRMASVILDQQGLLNDAKAKIKGLEGLVAEVRRVLALHDGCNTNCDLELDLKEVLDGG